MRELRRAKDQLNACYRARNSRRAAGAHHTLALGRAEPADMKWHISFGGLRGGPGSRASWTLLACLILALGLAVSIGGAFLWRSSERARERQTFQTAATDVSETMETLLRRDTDFVATLRAVLTMQPRLSASGFRRWFTVLEGHQRQLGGLGTPVIKLVPAANLAAFQARRDHDPVFRSLVGGKVAPLTADGRAHYCLFSAGRSILRTPPQSRVCSRETGAIRVPHRQVSGGRDLSGEFCCSRSPTEGSFSCSPWRLMERVRSSFESAVYRRGARLSSIAQRRAALIGWVSSSFDVKSLMRSAIAEHHGLAMTLSHANPGHSPQVLGRTGCRFNCQPLHAH